MPLVNGTNGVKVHKVTENSAKRDPEYQLFPNLGFNHDTSKFSSQPRPFKVICIGAGFSGVYMGLRLPMMCPDVELTIYEKNEKVGGTWFENTYPGAACDVPAHRYAYTFELYPHWSTFYAGSDEIRDYIEYVAKKYKSTDYIKLRHQVVAAHWKEDDGTWEVTVKGPDGNIFKDSCNILINAAGPLNHWKWPDIPNREKFKGKMLHSANYDRSFDHKDRNVGIIGSGSSSIQIVAAIQKDVKHLGVHMRSNTWITPPFQSNALKKKEDGELDLSYSEEEKKQFRSDAKSMILHRTELEKGITNRFQTYLKNGPVQEEARNMVAKDMERRLAKKPELAEKLIPNWYLGCKRQTPGIGYLEALCEDNVDIVFDNIKTFTENGIMTKDGKEHVYDDIICATGFDVSHVPRFELVGRDGYTVGEEFRKNPYGYMCIAMKGFPNYFLINGPNAPIGQGSLVPASEQQGDYICQVIQKMRTQDVRSIQIRDKAIEHFTRYVDRWMEDAVWTGGCRSWYKNHTVNGRVTALWAGSGLHFIEALSSPRWEDWDFTYEHEECMFSYFNSGFTEIEHKGMNRNRQLLERIGVMKNHPRLSEQERQEKIEQEQIALDVLAKNP